MNNLNEQIQKAFQEVLPKMLDDEVERQRREMERAMQDCEMYGKPCSYGICDECPLINPEYGG